MNLFSRVLLILLVAAGLGACGKQAEETKRIAAQSGQQTQAAAKGDSATDVYHGVAVTDPFRWLEDWDDPQVKTWSAAQNEHARATRAADISRVFDAALGGDMVAALAVLDSIPQNQLSPKDLATADCIRTTFHAAPVPEDLPPRSRSILNAYRSYWQGVMLRRMDARAAEERLLTNLNAIVGTDSLGPTRAESLEVASERAKAAIEQEGLDALAGVTSPYWEMMIWRTQTPTTYHVKLTDGAIDVKVVFLDDFVSLGWAGYATCGRAHTGGWATSDALYSLQSSYDLDSENFRVSYLAHEGRHFSDYKRFPKLEQPELEYRAKLTEIALSDATTYTLMIAFARRSGRDRGVPHSFANFCVARDLARLVFGGGAGDGAGAGVSVGDSAMWAAVSAERLRGAARKLLSENDARLNRMGSAGVTRFLDEDEPRR